MEKLENSMPKVSSEKSYSLMFQIGNRTIYLLVNNVTYGTDGIIHAMKIGEEDRYSLFNEKVFKPCINVEIAVLLEAVFENIKAETWLKKL